MKFEIQSLIFEKFLGLNIGVVIARNIDNFGLSEEIMKRIKEIERDIRSAYNTETAAFLALSKNPGGSRPKLRRLCLYRPFYSRPG